MSSDVLSTPRASSAAQATGTKLYRHVIETIRSEIRDGIYTVGDRLPSERVLVERFGVSRLTVREALIGLEILELVQARQGAGVFVIANEERKDLPVQALDIGAFELTEARRIVEVQAAALAAHTATPEEIDELRGIMHEMAAENRGQALPEWTADRRFHVAIARATQNEAIVMLVNLLWDVRKRSPLCHTILQRITAAGERPRLDDHRRILDAIAAHDPVEARAAMQDHIDRVLKNLFDLTETEALRRLTDEQSHRRSKVTERLSI